MDKKPMARAGIASKSPDAMTVIRQLCRSAGETPMEIRSVGVAHKEQPTRPTLRLSQNLRKTNGSGFHTPSNFAPDAMIRATRDDRTQSTMGYLSVH